MEEIWKDIKEYKNAYQVSNLGNVRSIDRQLPDGRKRKGIILKPYVDKDGYKHVTLTQNGKSTHYIVHRLVAIAFIENPNKLPIINHKDESKDNNCVNNLEWCNVKYNINYGKRTEKVMAKIRGENHYAHKLTNEIVKEIRRNYIEGDREYGQGAMARKYGVTQSVIHNIIKRNIWKHV